MQFELVEIDKENIGKGLPSSDMFELVEVPKPTEKPSWASRLRSGLSERYLEPADPTIRQDSPFGAMRTPAIEERPTVTPEELG